MSEAESASLMPTGEVTRVETKPENAPAVSVSGDNYLVAGPIPFVSLHPPLSMNSSTTRGFVMRVFRVHPDQSVLLTPHLRHSRFWEISNYKITLTPVANKLNTSGRICAYFVANPYTANSLDSEHEVHRALTAERRWELDCQTELVIDLDFGGMLKNCSVTPELFFNQLGCLRVVCLAPPQSDACPTWQVKVSGTGSFYGIDSFDNRLFRSEPVFNLEPNYESGRGVLAIKSKKKAAITALGSVNNRVVEIPVTFNIATTSKILKGTSVELQLSKRLELSYSPHLASKATDELKENTGNLVLDTTTTRLFALTSTLIRYTCVTLIVEDVIRWTNSGGATPKDDVKYSDLKDKLPLIPLYSGRIQVTYDYTEDVTALVSLPKQEGRIIMSGPWVA